MAHFAVLAHVAGRWLIWPADVSFGRPMAHLAGPFLIWRPKTHLAGRTSSAVSSRQVLRQLTTTCSFHRNTTLADGQATEWYAVLHEETLCGLLLQDLLQSC